MESLIAFRKPTMMTTASISGKSVGMLPDEPPAKQKNPPVLPPSLGLTSSAGVESSGSSSGSAGAKVRCPFDVPSLSGPSADTTEIDVVINTEISIPAIAMTLSLITHTFLPISFVPGSGLG